MVKFKDIIITDLGQHALNEAITGHTKITFTKAVLASDDVASKTVQDVKAITTLDDQKETSVALLSSQNGAIVLSVTYDNDGLTKDIIFNSVGWYAMTDSTEFLFAVSRYSQPQYLTAVPPDTDETQSITLQVSLAVGQGNVQVVQTQAGVAMKADLNRAVKDWDNSIQQLTDIKADKSQVASDLAKKADQSSVDASVKSINDVLATKANSSDVSDELALKANQSDLEKTNAEVAKKANSADVYTKIETDNQINKFDLSKVKFRKQYVNSDGQTADKTWSATKNQDGTYTIDLWQDDWTASKLSGVLAQLPNKADTSTVNAQIADAKNTVKSSVDNLHNDLQNQINNKANASDLSNYATASDLAGYAKSTDVASKAQITDLQNQISELKESNFEVQTFKDETSGKTWEAQKPGHRLAIIQS